ncbi:MAG: c-type cytochrome biogenesis protein CcmI [Pseudomonadota bacterium]
MVFWLVAGGVTLVSLLTVFRPLLRGESRAARRASYDMQVYRDQLKEVDVEVSRGILSEEEAEATKVEVSRRLLHAADAEATEEEAHRAPRKVSLAAGFGTVALVGAVALVVYVYTGAPGLPDQPLAVREQQMAEAHANRPGQAEAETALGGRAAGAGAEARAPVPPEDAALVSQLRDILKERPNDLQGHRLLARSLGALGEFAEARAAQEHVMRILGPDTTATDELELAELMILAAGGYVSPEAEAAIVRGLEKDPNNPLGRYFSGVTLLQAGRPELAYPLWTRLLEEGPADAPWIAPIVAQIGDVARLAGLPPPMSGFGTGLDAMGLGDSLSSDDQMAMIEGMVESLSARLASDGGPPSDWARLIRSLSVLGQMERARAVWEEAIVAFADQPIGLAEIEAEARDVGLLQ